MRNEREYTPEYMTQYPETRTAQLATITQFLELIEAVHAAGGTWKKYCLLPHQKLLTLRSLLARGRAQPGPATPPVVPKLLARSLPNEILWTILGYWNEQ